MLLYNQTMFRQLTFNERVCVVRFENCKWKERDRDAGGERQLGEGVCVNLVGVIIESVLSLRNVV